MSETQGFEALQQIATPSADNNIPAEPKIDQFGRAYATGKRKNAVARVWIKPGKGAITINGRDQEVYFARPVLRMMLAQPLQVAGRLGEFDVIATVQGSGLSGQAGRRSPRHLQGSDLLRAGPAHRVEAARLPDARQPGRGTQEVRSRQGPPQLPVLQALISLQALSYPGASEYSSGALCVCGVPLCAISTPWSG